MATTTGYLGLTKPAYTEAADIAVINGNMDKIDQAAGRNARVWNLLDNSNFEIAQAGLCGMHGSTMYLADRWQASTGLIAERVNGITTLNNGNSGSVAIVQYLSDDIISIIKTQPTTIAACLGDGSIVVQAINPDTNLYNSSGIVNSKDLASDGGSNGWRVDFYQSNASSRIRVRIYSMNSGETISLKWVAVYLGAYTAETLPAYVPKGYAAELAECQRYYVAYTGKYICAAGVGDNNGCVDVSFPLPVKMRIIPTVRFGVWSDGVYTQNDTVNVSVNGTRSYMAATQYYNTESVVTVRLVNAALINAPCSVFFSFTASADL